MDKMCFNELKYLKIIVTENKIDSDRQLSEESIKSFMNEHEIKDNMKISIKEETGIKELSDKIKEYVNHKEEDIPNNFSCHLKNEYKLDNKEVNISKESKTINIIFLGNTMVGKTCLYLRLNKNYYKESFLSTIGIERQIKTFKYKDEIYKINLCDTAGQDRYRTLPRKYYQNANGIFLLFDLSNKESFNDISVWMNEVKNNLGSTKDNTQGLIIYLIGNKLDKLDRVISREEAEDKASFYGIKYFEISCKLNINVQEMYARMVSDCIPYIKDKKEQSAFQVKFQKKKKKVLKDGLCC